MDNYYNNQIKDYLINFENASSEVTKIYNLLNNLYATFSSATGVDINKIRNDIEMVAGELNALKSKLDNAKNNTKERADNCDSVYKAIQAMKPTPTFRGSNDVFESLGDKKVYIDGGIIYWTEKFRKIPKSSYDGLWGGVAAVGKLFNSYQVITSTTHQDVESMFNGVVKMI